MTNHIEDKVTGAASGFGKLTAIKAAARGAKLACADINEAGLHETVCDITNAGHQAIGRAVEATNWTTVIY